MSLKKRQLQPWMECIVSIVSVEASRIVATDKQSMDSTVAKQPTGGQ